MQIAKIQDNNIQEINDYRLMFSNTSFGINGVTDEFLEENSCLKVNVFKPYDRATEKLVSCEPYIEDNWVYTVSIEPKTEEDISADTSAQASAIRSQRDQLLKDTDWTQIKDVPVDQESYATYRQELRDITLQDGFPHTVVWPDKP